MKNNMTIYYDEEADFLEFNMGESRKGYFRDTGNDIFERIDEKTNKVTGIAIFNFKKRAQTRDIKIPLPVKLEIS